MVKRSAGSDKTVDMCGTIEHPKRITKGHVTDELKQTMRTKYGIEPLAKHHIPSRETVVALLILENWAPSAVALLYDVTPATVKSWLVRHNLPRHEPHDKKLRDLERAYDREHRLRQSAEQRIQEQAQLIETLKNL